MKPLFRAWLYYISTFTAGFILISLITYYLSPHFFPSPSGELYGKYLYYIDNREKYDLLFLGDSRTYCAVQPELIDKTLGTTSFNLAHWTNWLPTQYPLVRDLAMQIPKKTTVVLLVGHNNFQESKIFDKYPIGIFNIKEYFDIGFSFWSLYDNLASFNPLLHFFSKRANIRKLLFRTFDISLLHAATDYTTTYNSFLHFFTTKANVRKLLLRNFDNSLLHATTNCTTSYQYEEYAKRPAVVRVQPVKAEGIIRSLALHKNNGGYERIELDEEFFRSKQQLDPNKPLSVPPQYYDARYIQLFKKILSSFKSAGTKLLVVEIEEAPYRYGSSANRETWRTHLRNTIQKDVEANGYPYITLPWDNIPDAGYFDYNHLNSKGIALFTPMITKALAPYLSTTSPKYTP